MEKIDFSKLKKMPPEQRAKALKEMQEALTKLINERNKEISGREGEIKAAQEFLQETEKELRVLKEIQSKAPELKSVNIEKLFDKKEAPKSAPAPRKLESIAEDAPKTQTTSEQKAYITSMSRQPISNLYDGVNQIRNEINSTGLISFYQQERLDQFREAIRMKEDAIKNGQYQDGWKKEGEITAAEKAIMYAGSTSGKSLYNTKR